MATIRAIAKDPNETWEDVSWDDMNDVEQGLWAKLGWNKSSWEEDTDAPAADDKDWDDLSSSERGALEQLGYTQASWDE